MRNPWVFAAVLSLSTLAVAHAQGGVAAKLDAVAQRDLAKQGQQQLGWKAKTDTLGRIASDRKLNEPLKARNQYILLGTRSGEVEVDEPIASAAWQRVKLTAPTKVKWEERLVRMHDGVYSQVIEARAEVTQASAAAAIANFRDQLATKPSHVFVPDVKIEHTAFGPRYIARTSKIKVGFFSRGTKLEPHVWDAHLATEGMDKAVDAAVEMWASETN